MDKKTAIASVTGVVVVGLLSYLGYRVLKEINEMHVDFMGENIEDDYHYRTPKK
jgi:hypothetical protein